MYAYKREGNWQVVSDYSEIPLSVGGYSIGNGAMSEIMDGLGDALKWGFCDPLGNIPHRILKDVDAIYSVVREVQ